MGKGAFVSLKWKINLILIVAFAMLGARLKPAVRYPILAVTPETGQQLAAIEDRLALAVEALF